MERGAGAGLAWHTGGLQFALAEFGRSVVQARDGLVHSFVTQHLQSKLVHFADVLWNNNILRPFEAALSTHLDAYHLGTKSASLDMGLVQHTRWLRAELQAGVRGVLAGMRTNGVAKLYATVRYLHALYRAAYLNMHRRLPNKNSLADRWQRDGEPEFTWWRAMHPTNGFTLLRIKPARNDGRYQFAWASDVPVVNEITEIRVIARETVDGEEW